MENDKAFTFLSLMTYRDHVRSTAINSSSKNELVNRLDKAIDFTGNKILVSVESNMERHPEVTDAR